MPNAADPKAVDRRELVAEQAQRRFDDALRKVLETPAGRLVFGVREHGLIARGRALASVFDDNPLEMARRAGRQEYALEILAIVWSAGEDVALQMEADMRAIARQDDARLSAKDEPPKE